MDSGKLLLAGVERKPIHLPGYVCDDAPLGPASQDQLRFNFQNFPRVLAWVRTYAKELNKGGKSQSLSRDKSK